MGRILLPSRAHSSFQVVEGGFLLRANAIQKRDAGRYECVAVRNSSHGGELSIRRNYTVIVTGTERPKEELLEPEYQTFTQRVGDKLKFRCSVRGENPVYWLQITPDGEHYPHAYEGRDNVAVHPIKDLKYVSSQGDVVGGLNGQEIVFDPIREENFGNYTCIYKRIRIRNVTLIDGDDSVELKISLVSLAIMFILLIFAVLIGWFWRWEVRLLWKDRFGKLEENDEKEYDVFVSYDTQDAPFVLGTLVPVLEDHFQYRCFAWERDTLAGEWISETLVQSIRLSRRFLIVLSPALLENRWCAFALYIALKAVLQLRLHIICVKLQEIDWSEIEVADKSANDTIRQVLRVVRTVEWKTNQKTLMALHNQQLACNKSIFKFDRLLKKPHDIPDDVKAPGHSRFWRKLRLYLPPRRSLPDLNKQPESPTSTKSLLSLSKASEYC